MSIRIAYEADGAIVVSCGDESVIIGSGSEARTAPPTPPPPKDEKPDTPIEWGAGSVRFMASSGVRSIRTLPEVVDGRRWDIAVSFDPSEGFSPRFVTIRTRTKFKALPGRRIAVIVAVPTGKSFEPNALIDYLKDGLDRTYGLEGLKFEFAFVPVRVP